MSRPFQYKKVGEHHMNDRNIVSKALWSVDTVYCLEWNGELLTETTTNQHAKTVVKKYAKLIYPNKQQAQTKADKINRAYMINCTVKKLTLTEV